MKNYKKSPSSGDFVVLPWMGFFIASFVLGSFRLSKSRVSGYDGSNHRLYLSLREKILDGEDTMTRKLILFDIDGTLLDQNKGIPKSTKEAIQALQEAGHEVALATGRAPYYIDEVREALQIDSFICFNGQYVEVDQQVIYKKPIEKELLKQLFAFASSQGHSLIYMGAKEMKSTARRDRLMEDLFATVYVDGRRVERNDQYFNEEEIYQALLFCEEVEEAVYHDTLKDLTFVRWHPNCMDVISLGGSKAIGVEKYMEYRGYTKDQVYAFGDNLNDMEMLQYVGHGVAMGNAPDAVKQAAKYVTKAVGDDGIAYGLKKLGLIE